ncbi:hypothetical protein [Agaribacterium haliotis]|uniref:hypothetical protein n=1 Tax=Agaribacterium haliotis TaxID=2013869 RepID=UPI000BB55C56|nr:hypothetical protein [Agaribacterium haliotis]
MNKVSIVVFLLISSAPLIADEQRQRGVDHNYERHQQRDSTRQDKRQRQLDAHNRHRSRQQQHSYYRHQAAPNAKHRSAHARTYRGTAPSYYKKHSKKHQRRAHKRHRADHFWAGYALGALTADGYYASHNHHSSHTHHRGKRHGAISYWRNAYGECYRVEHRARGKVYVPVPLAKCY